MTDQHLYYCPIGENLHLHKTDGTTCHNIKGDHVAILDLSAAAKHIHLLDLSCFLFDGPFLARKVSHLTIHQTPCQMRPHPLLIKEKVF